MAEQLFPTGIGTQDTGATSKEGLAFDRAFSNPTGSNLTESQIMDIITDRATPKNTGPTAAERLKSAEAMADARASEPLDNPFKSEPVSGAPLETQATRDFDAGKRTAEAVAPVASGLMDRVTGQAQENARAAAGVVADDVFSRIPGAEAMADRLGDMSRDVLSAALPVANALIDIADPRTNPLSRDLFDQKADAEQAERLAAIERQAELEAFEALEELDRLSGNDRSNPCDYGGQKDSMGRQCGGRSAEARPGGKFG